MVLDSWQLSCESCPGQMGFNKNVTKASLHSSQQGCHLESALGTFLRNFMTSHMACSSKRFHNILCVCVLNNVFLSSQLLFSGVEKTDLVRFKRRFEGELLKDKLPFF